MDARFFVPSLINNQENNLLELDSKFSKDQNQPNKAFHNSQKRTSFQIILTLRTCCLVRTNLMTKLVLDYKNAFSYFSNDIKDKRSKNLYFCFTLPLKSFRYFNWGQNKEEHSEKSANEPSEEGNQQRIRISNESELFSHLENAARLASFAYCLDENEDEVAPGIRAKAELVRLSEQLVYINLYISGLDYSQEEWIKRPFHLVNHSTFENALIDTVFQTQFILAKDNIRQRLDQVLSREVTKGDLIQNINVIGHSVGGVYAVLTAISWISERTQNLPPIFVITFGQPRMGNIELAKILNQMILLNDLALIRVTHTDDYVPRLPIQKPHLLMHHEHEIWIKSECECPKETEIYFCQGRSLNYKAGIIEENQFCINGNSDQQLGKLAHNGPYFGYIMGTCQNL
ncbi:hypothetical protein G9A89_008949 [Geosiphon pyriformis]|nr:hypothetical protein G9A89_008949 [Geosiphon pyriformis]